MSDSWDDYADGWDSNEAVVLYSNKAYESLLNIVNLDGLRVLDFGCGTGLLTNKIACKASSVVAIDPSEKMIDILNAKQLDNVVTIPKELSKNTIASNTQLQDGFDLIVASSALAFVPDYQETLGLLKTLLNQGGVLVQWDWLKEQDGEGSGFSQASIEVALKQAGFSEYSTSVPFSMEAGEDSMKVVMGVAKNL